MRQEILESLYRRRDQIKESLLNSRITHEVLREMTTDGAAGDAGGGFGTVVDPPENWAQDSDDGSGPSGNKSPDADRFDTGWTWPGRFPHQDKHPDRRPTRKPYVRGRGLQRIIQDWWYGR